jgi:hypothetical protein
MQPQPDETKPELSTTLAKSAETEPELSGTMEEVGETKLELSITPAEIPAEGAKQNETKLKAKGGRPRKAPDTGVWAVRGVDLETRAIVEKTAQRAGKTMGQFVNEDVRSFCQGQLTQSQLPASPRDLQVQMEQLTQLVEGIAARMNEPARKGFWQRVFGK